MKRARFHLLFGGLFLCSLGYVGWCWRTFLVGVAAPPLSELPTEFRATATEEIRDEGLLSREQFRWDRAKELLLNPFKTAPPQLEITTPESHLGFVDRDYPFSSVVFAKYRTGWARVPDNQKIP
ncbi:hypothetical protein HNR46_004289 [Haloferula luteola]|uniref:Uncharacterized protein n=1 Tax=Haloferula luteola TaxID=595692 RepID=A0A840V6Y0_9BACT|nr:hypothetical protein [Haloferula luteola]MBB5354017.1 hypothetical protein [Haloferula luteola]